MKIACILATRGRPERAAAAIEIANALSSVNHELRFIVCCDSDDTETILRFGDIELSVAPSPMSVAEVWNRGAALCPEADVICPMVDDSFIAAPDWDEIIVSTFERLPPPLRVMAWNDTANRGLATLPIIGRQWYDAAGLYVGWFPYWFYDTWLAEVYSFVAGFKPLIPESLLLTAKKGKTQRMRDLGFWWRFYSATRSDRLLEASRLRETFNLPDNKANREAMVRDWQERDEGMLSRIDGMEALMTDGNSQMPSDKYLAVKAKAEAHLAGIKL